ncbi:hypothetical protein MPLDJ20_80309 [Mesorhizobium plurifarium]|uniref:Uncharacterized protein n=1 Tax=Mesorhizobium plurifarium TaxID=69974 RepID=A0A090FXI3_MESPL|nr:hypothetical protein MPLDJ20_80309 [Mesorhizobium plurifarium]
MLFVWLPQFRTENRYALFLELLFVWFGAIPDGKPLRTFPGIALRRGPVRPLDARGVFLFP